jgi:dolichyl-phosphate beta-glucosyltransferase
MNNTAVSIVIPCFNEEKNLKRGVLDDVNNFLETQPFKWEVLICNDASTDGSLPLLKTFASRHHGFSVLNLPHGGKPSAVWQGIQKAAYPLVLFTDMDQSTPLKEILKLLPFSSGYDLIIGSRGITRQGNSLIRRIGGPVFLAIRRLILLPNITDTQCGFKLINTAVARIIFPRLAYFTDKSSQSGWRVSSFDVELLFMAQKWGYKIREVVVDWRNEDTSDTKGDNNARFKKESIQMLKEIIRVKIDDFHGKYVPPKI